MGVIGLAAGGALGFLWITAPHGSHSASSQSGDEVALVSLRGVEPSKPNAPPAQQPDPSPSADAPWSVANYTGDAADEAATRPMPPQPRMAAPPSRPPVTRAAALPPSQPAPAAVATASTPPPPAPAAVTVPPPAPVAVAPADREEVNDLLMRARSFLASGDVAAARVILRRAAEYHDAQATLALGGTFDPTVLKKLGIISYHHADAEQAREWYRKAAALGSADATLRLEQMAQTDH